METRGFVGRGRDNSGRIPPGQHDAGHDFPVMIAGGAVELAREDWRLTVGDGVVSKTYDWDSLHALGTESITVDIHCVTHWTKLDTTWGGVPVGALFDDAGVGDYDYSIITSYGEYTTNLPTTDLVDESALIATSYDGAPITAEHGGPVRLVVPHLYFWKSAKWIQQILLSDQDEPGFWEVSGYHNYGDPWLEQRYSLD